LPAPLRPPPAARRALRPRGRAALLAALLAAGCPKEAPPAGPPEVVPDTPVLPAPLAPAYARGAEVPADPLVARVVEQGGLRWSESLSGAAGALALSGAPAGSATWACVRAGYPHPVELRIQGLEAAGAWPSGLIEQLRGRVRAGDDVGLARARSLSGDRWVALVGRPQIEVPPFPRELRVGEVLTLPDLGVHYALVSPRGRIVEGATPLRHALDAPGEWLLELIQPSDGRTLLSAPLFVGEATPLDPPFAESGPPAGPDAARAELLRLIDDLRADHGLPTLSGDPTLDGLARHPLEQLRAGAWDRGAGEARLRAAGFVGGPVAQLSCAGPTVAACLGQIAGQARGRVALLQPGLRLVGLATEVRADGLLVVLNLSSE